MEQQRKVLFASSKPLERAENIKAIYDRYDGEKAFTVLSFLRDSVDISSGYYDILVTDEYPAQSPGKVIMVNHAVNGGKTFGFNMKNPYMPREDSKLITCATASSKDMVGIVAKECGIKRWQVFPTGLPRTDAYIGKRKGHGRTFLSKKRAYLYAPTFRKEDETPMPDINWKRIDDLLTDDEIFVVKPHYWSGYPVDREYKHIVSVFSSLPSTPYLIDCDVLITDYSSIMFDALLLRKPVVLFEKDPGYLETRGMYFEYPFGYSSRYCTDEDTLVEMIRNAHGLNKQDIACRDRVASACDGHSTERVIELIRRFL